MKTTNNIIVEGAKVFAPFFNENEVYISKLAYPVGNKYYRVVGLGGKVQEAFLKLFNADMLLLSTLEEVDNILGQVKIYLN